MTLDRRLQVFLAADCGDFRSAAYHSLLHAKACRQSISTTVSPETLASLANQEYLETQGRCATEAGNFARAALYFGAIAEKTQRSEQ